MMEEVPKNGLMDQYKEGNISQITSLFSNDGSTTESNLIAQNLIGQLGIILQNKGAVVTLYDETEKNYLNFVKTTSGGK